jgi:hypothetical protein
LLRIELENKRKIVLQEAGNGKEEVTEEAAKETDV